MPIYEYQCDDCGQKLEKLQKISDAALTDCPDCGTASLKKLVSAAAFRLKGAGWYETDFKEGKSQKNLVKPDDKPATDKDEKGADKKDTPAEKKEDDSGKTTTKKATSESTTD